MLSIAEGIGPGLARAAVAGKIDGELVDLRVPLQADVDLQIITKKDPEAGEVIRHSTEHIMADAVKRLFPNAQVDAGRSDHSEKFQYDFLVENPFTPEDLEQIEKQMKKIIKSKAVFTREVVSREEARALFKGMGEELKLSRLDDIPEGAEITIFRQGEFVDLCRGPHVWRSDQIGAFKLTELAGAYWRGDERNPMLQRIYGTAFATKGELAEHLERLEEAKRRDHRRLGQQLDLFHIDPISPGSPFFHAKGMVIYNELTAYIRELYQKYGYGEVMTPQIVHTDLFKTSGHYENYAEDMFLFETDECEMGVKPMNCPGHAMLFDYGKRSYRDLPIRMAEFSQLHRNERSGTLTGLTRVRSFSQDDAHIFCTPDQVEGEIESFFAMLKEVYGALGLDQIQVAVSTRGEKFIGTPERWDIAEQRLVQACKNAGFEPEIKPGDAAFYAPKVEIDVLDVLGRSWTLGTIQLDMAMPDRFGLSYTAPDGSDAAPEMLHRAILGSLERFIAIYLEHTAGDFPLWLAPVQVVVLPITERHAAYGHAVAKSLRARGLRVHVDDRSEKLGYKIREAEVGKIPLMCVVGDQEEADGTVAPRRRHVEGDGDAVALDEFAEKLAEEVRERRSVNIGTQSRGEE